MKKFIAIMIVMGLSVGIVSAAHAKDIKIGTVDIFRVFNEYQKTKDYDKVLEAKQTIEVKKLNDKKTQIEQMQNKAMLMSEADKLKEKDKIDKTFQDYRDMEKTAFDTVKTDRDAKMKEIIDDINGVIKDYAAANGYDLIVNENTVLYKDVSFDITSVILKLVNEKYKK